MIQWVKVTNYRDESITLTLSRPEESGMIITQIEGLGPGQATVNLTEMSTTDGALFNSARMSARNIVLSLKLMSKVLVEDIRLLTYKYFPLKKAVRLEFQLDRRHAYIDGYVESNEPDIFSNNETTQVSIRCPNPYFYEIGEMIYMYFGVDPLFEFIWDNNSLTNPLICFGEITGMIAKKINYTGDAMVGVNITINLTNEVHSNIEIANSATQEKMVIDIEKIIFFTNAPLIANDNIIIDTRTGYKSMYLLRNGVFTNIINCLDKNTQWLHIDRGDNYITFISASDMENIQVEIEYNIVYEGI